VPERDGEGLRTWDELSADEQLRLREAYGHYLDGLPPTCDLGTKEQRFMDWLREQGVNWRPA
jgi:hypothetical protein